MSHPSKDKTVELAQQFDLYEYEEYFTPLLEVV